MNDGANYVLPEVRKCMGYEKLGSVEIRLLDLDSFISSVMEFKPDTIWSCYGPMCNKFKTADGKPQDFEQQKPNPNVFFFVKGNEIYSAESEGFELLADYVNAKKIGFLETEAYMLFDYISEKYKDLSIAYLYYDALENGYTDFDEYNMSYRFYDDFVPVSTFRDEQDILKKHGFKKKRDWEIAKQRGFEEGKDYYDARSEGIESYCEYKDFKILYNKGIEYGIAPPYKFHIFHIINRLRGGERIGIEDMKAKLRNESYYYKKDWYEWNWDDVTTEQLSLMLSSEKLFNTMGKLTTNSGNLEYSLYRNDTIFVDGSNVAWNNIPEEIREFPYARNIEVVVKELKKIGFKMVLVLCDNNLYDIVADKDKFSELIKTGIVQFVTRGTTADEWLLRFKEDKDRFIVSNDKYKQYKEKYPDIGNHRIGFQVSGDEAKFDDKIKGAVDGIPPKHKLPRLCHQSDDL